MFKRTVLIDLYALEEMASEMEFSDPYETVREFEMLPEDGVCFVEYQKKRMYEYKKEFSEDAVTVLEKFFNKHQIDSFTIVAVY